MQEDAPDPPVDITPVEELVLTPAPTLRGPSALELNLEGATLVVQTQDFIFQVPATDSLHFAADVDSDATTLRLWVNEFLVLDMAAAASSSPRDGALPRRVGELKSLPELEHPRSPLSLSTAIKRS